MGGAAALAAGGATWWLLDLPATFVAEVGVLYGGLAAVLMATLPLEWPSPSGAAAPGSDSGMGAANRITFGRAIILLPLAALAFHPSAFDTAARWLVVVVGTVIMVLDGFDGWMARRTGTESAFGARFDMETDAFLMLVLSVLVWVEGRAGAWVLLIGGMRYLFVAAGWVAPKLQGDLFPSLRRKVVCVVQGVVLLVALGPIIPDLMAVTVAAAGLGALVYSFGVDTVWLLRQEVA